MITTKGTEKIFHSGDINKSPEFKQFFRGIKIDFLKSLTFILYYEAGVIVVYFRDRLKNGVLNIASLKICKEGKLKKYVGLLWKKSLKL